MRRTWVDEAAVCDQGIVTSGNRGDPDTFEIAEEISEGIHRDRAVA